MPPLKGPMENNLMVKRLIKKFGPIQLTKEGKEFPQGPKVAKGFLSLEKAKEPFLKFQ